MTKNHLREETSPYLLQHKDNPVHWWPWGGDALKEAKQTGKPILLSVGYAACHWCHVMAHESFEDQETADLMNELYVNIKVDREERPDIDAIYMAALHTMNQQGGWPLTMFLDSDARPFWGGTYFPKTPAFGRPSFKDVLRAISTNFKNEPDKVAYNAELIAKAIENPATADHPAPITDALLSDLAVRMARACDPDHGGISGAPKFPQWTFFWFLWRAAIRYQNDDAKQAVETFLTNVCQGGIYDHLAGGFARYSVDERWLVPHFEKMLYDNALLIDLMSEVYRETKNPLLKVRVKETIAWLEREMIAAGGGFAASLDADSEGEEGKFYVWDALEVANALGVEDGKFFCPIYDVSPKGNWEGRNILNRLDSLQLLSDEEEERLANLRAKLLKRRERRIRPGWDDKVLADWNGLMIAALAHAGRVFDEPQWIDLARQAFDFVKSSMTKDGRLRHAYRNFNINAPATSTDYANMICAAIRLYETTGEDEYLDQAIAWTDILHTHYWVPERGRYAQSADDTSDVIVRISTGTDEATPNANGTQVSNLSSLALLTGDDRYREQAAMLLDSFSHDIAANLISHTGILCGALDLLAGQHIAIVGDKGADELKAAALDQSLPGALITCCKDKDSRETPPAWATDKTPQNNQAAAYACQGQTCAAPETDITEFTIVLKRQRAIPQQSTNSPESGRK